MKDTPKILKAHVPQFQNEEAHVLPLPVSENLRVPQSDSRNQARSRIDRELDYFYHTKFYDKIPRDLETISDDTCPG